MLSFLYIGFVLFIIGFFGIVLTRTHIIIVLVSLELLFLASNLNFVFFSIFIDDFLGQLYSLLILMVAAAETAIGLAILVIYYRLRGGIHILLISLLKS